MAKLPEETAETIWRQKRQLLIIIEEATATEYDLFELFGETNETMPFLEELKNVAEHAKTWFSRLSNAQLRIAETHPIAPSDMLELIAQTIDLIQEAIPAMERSIDEVKIEWNLP